VTPKSRGFLITLAACVVLVALLLTASRTYAADPPAPTTGTAYSGPCQPVESQAWWAKDGITIPSNVGQHVHVAACIPTTPVDGTVTLAVTVTQHNGTGAIRWVRACRESSYCQRWSVSLGPCADCSQTYYLPLRVGSWPTGVGELRLSANVSSNSDGLRQFQSTGWPVPVRSTTCSTRCSTFWEARGWYDSGHDYANARLTTIDARSGGTIKVRLGPGSGGDPTTLAGIYIDPAFHSGSAGIVVRQWSSSFTGSVTLPSLPSGPHKLVLLSSDGFNAGVLSVPFNVP
jgi:hypothetical protein